MNSYFTHQSRTLAAVLVIFILCQSEIRAQDSPFKLTDKQKNKIASTAMEEALHTLELQIEFIEQTCSIDAKQKHQLQLAAKAIAQEVPDQIIADIEKRVQVWDSVLRQLAPSATISNNVSSELDWGIANTLDPKRWDSRLVENLTDQQRKKLANAIRSHRQQLRTSFVEFMVNAVRVQIGLSEEQTKKVATVIDKHTDNRIALNYLADPHDSPLQFIYSIPAKEFEPILSQKQLALWNEIQERFRR